MLEYNRVLADWEFSYKEFLRESFTLGGQEYTGEDLILYYSGAQKPSYAAFSQFLDFFMGISVPAKARKKRTRREFDPFT